jgi:hypothetical protein
MNVINLMSGALVAGALAASVGAISASAASCPFSGPTAELRSLPGYKPLSTVDPVKVLDQLTISESNMIWTAVQGGFYGDSTGLDGAKAWAIFTDVPRFYNGGQIEYFALDKDRYALVSFYPENKQLGHVAKLATASSSARDYRKAKFEVLADVREGMMSCR